MTPSPSDLDRVEALPKCAAGHLIAAEICERCGATPDEPCREWVRNVGKENDLLESATASLQSALAEKTARYESLNHDFTQMGFRAASAENAAALAQARIGELEKALRDCLNYIENTESELGISLICGDKARAALASPDQKEEQR